jgi:pentatricopeptide repeat protein
MYNIGVKPNQHTAAAVLTACAQHQQVGLFDQVVHELKQKGVVPDKYCFTVPFYLSYNCNIFT